MKRCTARLFTFLSCSPFYVLLSITVLLSACGPSGSHFCLEGHFKNLNQGEFYLYNFEDATIDTLQAKDGRISFGRSLSDTLVLALLFPNFSELPVFAAPGDEVKIEGDVSHLKETTVTGSRENKLMTEFRLRTNDKMPPEVASEAEAFIRENPASVVSQYLLRRYFLLAPSPDYKKCYELCDTMQKAMPGSVLMARLLQQLATTRHYSTTGRVPKFKAVSEKGDTVTNATLSSKVNLILLWATWNSTSTYLLHQLHQLQQKHKGKLSILTISLNATPDEGRYTLERDTIKWPNICDGKLWQSPLLARLGMATIGDNIVFDDKGKVLARNLSSPDLRKKLEELVED